MRVFAIILQFVDALLDGAIRLADYMAKRKREQNEKQYRDDVEQIEQDSVDYHNRRYGGMREDSAGDDSVQRDTSDKQ